MNTTHITQEVNMKSITLTNSESKACGHHEPEGCDVAGGHEARATVRRRAQAMADATGRQVEIYATRRNCQPWLVDVGSLRVCLRGSMNLNANPRFEQLDVTEGGPDFDLVRQIENELPVLGDNASVTEISAASKVLATPRAEDVDAFASLRAWRPK